MSFIIRILVKSVGGNVGGIFRVLGEWVQFYLTIKCKIKDKQYKISTIIMDWKDFLIQNPWAPPRYLKERFPDFDEYDLSNWEKKF